MRRAWLHFSVAYGCLELWVSGTLEHYTQELDKLGKMLKVFARKAPQREKEAWAVLKTAAGVGAVTTEVVISELGDVTRFPNAKAFSAYAGLAPVVRQSGGLQTPTSHPRSCRHPPATE